MGTRLLTEIDNMIQSFMYLGEEYQQRVTETKRLTPSVAQWLLEAVNSRSSEFKAKVTCILDCTKNQDSDEPIIHTSKPSLVESMSGDISNIKIGEMN